MDNRDTNRNATLPPEHVIAFDYGLKYIGVAVGNIKTATTQPLQTIACKAGQADWQTIDKIFRRWQPCRFVVGYPDANSPPELLKKLDMFINQLHTRFDLPVDKGNESLSSIEAYHRLKTQRSERKIGRIARSDIDKVAAALILQSWFETRQTATVE